jgi:hypothetical protein
MELGPIGYNFEWGTLAFQIVIVISESANMNQTWQVWAFGCSPFKIVSNGPKLHLIHTATQENVKLLTKLP